jgi:hypothetical protein
MRPRRSEQDALIVVVPDRVPELAEPPRSRWAGAVLLAAALIALLIVPGLLNPGIGGQASPLAAPEPPAVGTCLLVAPRSQAQVDCGERHNFEIIQTWVAGTGPAQNKPAGVFDIPFGGRRLFNFGVDECAPFIESYLGAAPTAATGLWAQVPPQVTAQLVLAPAAESLGALRWSACALSSTRQQVYIGTLHDAMTSTPATLPSQFQTCVLLSFSSQTSSCDGRHRIELLGQFQPTAEMIAAGTALTGYTAEQIQASCMAFAAAVIGAPDPTYGGLLRVTAGPVFGPDELTTDDGISRLEYPDCYVEVAGRAGVLSSTVVGLAGGQLPLG